MKSVVITGSSRGIGYGMAEEFLRRGHQVTISGSSAASTGQASAALSAIYGPERINAQPCDVGDYAQVQALWASAAARFGRVDIWINNAAVSYPIMKLAEQTPERIHAQINTNLTGLLYCCQAAISGMLTQPGGGAIFNMEGMGSDGSIRDGLTVYGGSKYALRYVTKSLVKEMAGTPVRVSTLSPGMVLTDMLLAGYEPGSEREARAKRIFNILADKLDTVCPWLVEQILAEPKHGAHIAWLTGPKIGMRFMTAPFSRRNLFAESQ